MPSSRIVERPRVRTALVAVFGAASLLALVTALLLASLLAPQGASAAARITEGGDVTAAGFANRWSAIVSLQSPYGRSDRSRHICGGTLVSPRLVVTAAHCVFNDGMEFYVESAKLQVLTGVRELDTDDVTEAGRYDVESIFVHPGYQPDIGYYDAPNLGNDIAVLRLAEPATGTTPMPIIGAGEQALWGAGNGLASGARIAGWGLTANMYYYFGSTLNHQAEFLPAELQEAAIPIHEDAICERSSSEMNASADIFSRMTMFCTGSLDTEVGDKTNRVGACYGDSGGPMIVPDGSGGWRLAGVTSWGPSGCSSYSVYTRVPAYRGWIESFDTNRFGAGGVQPATNVGQTVVGPHTVRVRWSHAGPAADRFRLFKRNFIKVRGGGYFWFGYAGGAQVRSVQDEYMEVGFLEGGTGRNARMLLLDDVEPRRTGQKKFHYYALDVVDQAGNHAPRQNIRVTAPLDDARPAAPGTPKVIAWRGNTPKLWWLPATDNDAISRYVVQLRTSPTALWRTWDGTNARCWFCSFYGYGYTAQGLRRELFQWSHNDSATGRNASPTNVVRLRHLRSGTTYLARVIAIDRAGNRRVSRAGVFRVS